MAKITVDQAEINPVESVCESKTLSGTITLTVTELQKAVAEYLKHTHGFNVDPNLVGFTYDDPRYEEENRILTGASAAVKVQVKQVIQ